MKGVLIALVVGLACVLFVAYILIREAKKTFYKLFPDKSNTDRARLLKKGLSLEGFFDPIDRPNKLKVVDNDYLTGLIEGMVKDKVLFNWAAKNELTVTSCNLKEVPYGWILCSKTHAIGFGMEAVE